MDIRISYKGSGIVYTIEVGNNLSIKDISIVLRNALLLDGYDDYFIDDVFNEGYDEIERSSPIESGDDDMTNDLYDALYNESQEDLEEYELGCAKMEQHIKDRLEAAEASRLSWQDLNTIKGECDTEESSDAIEPKNIYHFSNDWSVTGKTQQGGFTVKYNVKK
jgi:hypothetical protein